MANNIQIGIDPRTMKHLSDQFDLVKNGAGDSMYLALIKVAFKIKSEAQLRLTGRGHIITSRLKNSIFVKGQKHVNGPDNGLTYTDTKGKSYKSDLSTVRLAANELAIGTNVEYGPAIEFGSRPHVIEAKNRKVLSNGKYFFSRRVNHPGWAGDSFLYWAMKNVDVTKSVGQDMANDLKYGKFLKPGVTK